MLSQASPCPVLIVDKQGTVGNFLAMRLEQKFLTVLVSSQELLTPTIIFVPFAQKIPTIPDNTFSHLFLFYNGEKELQLSLQSFISKAAETEARLILVTTLFHYSDTLAHKLIELYPKSQVIVLGDVFPSSSFSPQTPVTTLLAMAKTTGQVVLTSSGLDVVYPVSLEDVLDGLIAVGIENQEEGQVFALLPSYPVTQISFARTLQRRYPLLKIDFAKGKHHLPSYHLPTSAIPLLPSPYPLAERLGQLDLEHTPLASPQAKPSRQIHHPRAGGTKRNLFLLLSLVFFTLSLPFLLTIGLALGGGLSLKQAEAQLSKGELASSYASAKSAQSLFSLADDTSTTLKSIVGIIGLGKEVVGFQRMIHLGREVSEAVTQLLGAASSLQTMLESKTPPTKDEYARSANQLKEGMILLQAIQAEGNLPAVYQEKLTALQRPLSMLINLTDASPLLLGFERPQRYLLLFQNNAELRPTGGFIGSYGLVTLEKAKMTQFQLFDVYDADGKLTADIKPPFPLNRYLGASHWFLRDSNYSIDFRNSASEAVSFLKLETGEKVDGVIALDVAFLSSLLEATGSLRLSDYKETLTKDNFYPVTQKYVETDFFPGSTQKKDFLRSVEQALMTKLQKREFSYQKMLTVLSNAALEKHLLFSFPDATLQKLFSLNNLSSALAEQRRPEEGVLLDTVGINEANLGQNKSNFYLLRKLSQEVMIDGDGGVFTKVQVRYTNTSTKADLFGGDYKAYVRLITPEGTTLTEVMVDATVQPILPPITSQTVYKAASFKVGKGIEVEETVEEGRQLFGVYLEVPQGRTKTLTFSYKLADKASITQPSFEYELVTIKQPGTDKDPYKLTITYPLANKLFKASRPVSDLGGKLVYESLLHTDKSLRLTFVQR